MNEATTVLAALGTTAQVSLGDAEHLDEATRVMQRRLDELDRAASRFRPDSELMLIQSLGPGPRRVSGALAEAIHAALWAARATDGIVDPTVGSAMRAAGYDRDFAEVAAAPRAPRRSEPVPGWRSVRLDIHRRILNLRAGVELDLGATAKALAADRIAREIHRRFATDVLVSLGGDVATAGERDWDIEIGDDGPVVRISDGGLATSSTTVRSWTAGGRTLHHIIDPASAAPAASPWATVSVAARSCLAANAASTAAVVLAERAPGWLAEHGLPARLVDHDGSVTRVGDWPEDAA
jgi:thiamine biosynthesis lipoprotein